MEKKESYRHNLPHFQNRGQAYFVTWNLKNAIPQKVFYKYATKLNILKTNISFLEQLQSEPLELAKAKKEYFISRNKYILAYAEMLDNYMSPEIDLSQPEIREIMVQTLRFWHGVRLHNFAFTVMPNHVHWVFELYAWDMEGKQVFLQDILQSVKRFSSNRINKLLGSAGSFWQKESFDTTIRNERHLQYAIQYTLNNPVNLHLWPNSLQSHLP
jgi:REP element-mobilizing transposase RayT